MNGLCFVSRVFILVSVTEPWIWKITSLFHQHSRSVFLGPNFSVTASLHLIFQWQHGCMFRFSPCLYNACLFTFQDELLPSNVCFDFCATQKCFYQSELKHNVVTFIIECSVCCKWYHIYISNIQTCLQSRDYLSERLYITEHLGLTPCCCDLVWVQNMEGFSWRLNCSSKSDICKRPSWRKKVSWSHGDGPHTSWILTTLTGPH